MVWHGESDSESVKHEKLMIAEMGSAARILQPFEDGSWHVPNEDSDIFGSGDALDSMTPEEAKQDFVGIIMVEVETLAARWRRFSP